MPWTSLGNIILTRDWKVFPVPSLGGETFRYTNTITGAVFGYGLVACEYSEPGYHEVRRVWPVANQVILTLHHAPELRASGQIVRYIYGKLANRTLLGSSSDSWNVALEEFTQ